MLTFPLANASLVWQGACQSLSAQTMAGVKRGRQCIRFIQQKKTISIAYYDQSGNHSARDIMDIEHRCTSLHLPSLHLNNCFQNCKWYIHGIQIQLTDWSSNSVSAFIFLPLIPFVILDNSGTYMHMWSS